MGLSTTSAAHGAGRTAHAGIGGGRQRPVAQGEPIRVLIVDDDADDRLIIRRFLNGARSCRFSVEELDDPSALADILDRNAADVILMDQRLGDHTGTEVIRRIGGTRAAVPAILLTGTDDDTLEEEALVSGAAEHLNKADLSSRVLERAIKYVVKRHGDQQELRRRGEQLQLAWNEAARANRAKSVFLASMSHELRTPLNAILGFSSVLRQTPAAAQPLRVEEYAGYIHDGGEQLLHLVDNLLDIARIEAGQFLLGDEELDLAAILRAALAANDPLARKRGVAVAIDAPQSLPAVRADRAAVLQILQNLMSNATKYTRSGGRVTVSAAPYLGGIRVSVQDTGIGMTDDEVANALRPFMRNHQNAYVRSTEGAGLGLAIVTALIDQLDLTIAFASRPGHGTTVTVAFPPGRIVREPGPQSP